MTGGRAPLLVAPAVLALLAVVGCASPGGGGDPPAPGDVRQGFVRSVTPFPVLDEGGTPYDHPFLGGLLVPRPQFVDIDGDGDLDLFVQERHGELMFFENTGSPAEHHFVWRTDRYQDLEVGEWSRFVDLGGDGVMDLLAESRFSHIRVYRNVGGPTDPRFEAVADSLRDASGQPIFADRQNIPALHDLTCSGRPDLFLGRVDGTLARYRDAGDDEAGLPRFQLDTERFEGIEIVGQFVGSRHGANSMFFADLEGNGVSDLFWGDFFEPGLLRIQNRGSCASPSLRSTPQPVEADGQPIATSGFNAPYLVDLTGNGALDLFLGVLGGAFNPIQTAADNFHFYENLGAGRFTLRTRRFLSGIDVGSESVPALVDLDGDGDLDLVVANKIDPADPTSARLHWYENEGTATGPRFRRRDPIEVAPSFHYAPAFGDLWGDPLPALALGTWNDGIHIHRNVGTPGDPRFERVDSLHVELTRGSNAVPALADLTGNGLLDLVVGRSSGELSFYRNVGTASDPRFEFVTDRYMDLDVGRRGAPGFVDLDGNGLLDLVVGREEGGWVVYRNRGTREEPLFEEDSSMTLPLPAFSTPRFGDLTGNGRPDLVVGGAGGGLQFYENRGR